MSVGFWMMKPEIVYLGGNAEANWIAESFEYPTNTESSTQVEISEDAIKTAVNTARQRERDAHFAKLAVVKVGVVDIPLKEHRAITRNLPKELRAMLKRCKKETGHDFYDLLVSW